MTKGQSGAILLATYLLLGALISGLLLAYGCAFGSDNSAQVPRGAELTVERAKEDLSNRKGVDKEEIVIVEVKAVEWPDTSLGCPEPGMMYAQVITPGYRIVLSHRGQLYEYHSDQSGRVVYCTK